MPDKHARSKVASMPWYRCHFQDWEGEVATLDFETAGFLHFLHRLMIERKSPVGRDILLRMSKQRGKNCTTVDRITEDLVSRGLIYCTEHGLWCDIADSEVSYQEEHSRKTSERNAKFSRKRWEKTQQNQRKTMPDGDVDIDGRSHQGSVQDQSIDNIIDSKGTGLASAACTSSGGEEQPTAAERLKHIADAFDALCGSNGSDPSLARHDDRRGSDTADCHRGGDNNTTLAEHGRLVARCWEYDSSLTSDERKLVRRLQLKLDGGLRLTEAEAIELQHLLSGLDSIVSHTEPSTDDAEGAGWPSQNVKSPRKDKEAAR